MIHLFVADQFLDLVNAQQLEQAARATLKHQNYISEIDLSIVIEDDQHLQELNLNFLGIDAPTDVLSFPSGEEDIDPETGRQYLGDVIISYPRAVEQASTSEHTTLAELLLLVVHGTLHLLGHDHSEPGEKANMWLAQREILVQIGAQLSRLPD